MGRQATALCMLMMAACGGSTGGAKDAGPDTPAGGGVGGGYGGAVGGHGGAVGGYGGAVGGHGGAVGGHGGAVGGQAGGASGGGMGGTTVAAGGAGGGGAHGGGAGGTTSPRPVEKWVALPSLSMPRWKHTATVLADGRVLIVGGQYAAYDATAMYMSATKVAATAEIYDPATETFTATGSLAGPRFNHTATLLPDGRVLIAGGASDTALVAVAELFDPATGTFQKTGSLLTPRNAAVATLLGSGKVLIAGGTNGSDLASCELYDPATGSFVATGGLVSPRQGHTATVLTDGRVLLVGGGIFTIPPNFVTAEIYDPATGLSSATGPLAARRDSHTATRLGDGRVLIAGGEGGGGSSGGQQDLDTAEIFDPASSTFKRTGFLATERLLHTATLLPDGRVLIAGGMNHLGAATFLDSAEFFDPTSGAFTTAGTLVNVRSGHQAATLADGRVLLVGGSQDGNTAEIYDPAKGTFSARDLARVNHTATLLADGNVLLSAEPDGVNPFAVRHAVLFEPGADIFVATDAMIRARSSHTATLLKNNQVLFAGSYPWTNTASLMRAELYDPTVGRFAATPAMIGSRSGHTATLLPDDDVFVAGGLDSSTETFNVATNTWTASTPMMAGRQAHTATLLRSGKVLLVGGWTVGSMDNPSTLATAELYDAATGVVSRTGSMAVARTNHTATLLPDGRVLIAGGWTGAYTSISGYVGSAVAAAEIYDPATGAFSSAGSLATARYSPAGATLADGKIMIIGGSDSSDISSMTAEPHPLSSVEFFDPTTGTFTSAPPMTAARIRPTATLLADGRVLVVGGSASGLNHVVAQVEMYWP